MKSKSKEYDITFICAKGQQHFAEPILKELEKKFTIQYILPSFWTDYFSFMVKGKVVWVEWVKKYANRASKKNWDSRNIIFRLHGNEIKTKYMQKINWLNVDNVIFINTKFLHQFKQKVNSSVDTTYIPNAIDINSFPFHQKNYGKRICAYGFAFSPIKGYDKLIKMFKKLVESDSDFHLTIMGMNTKQKSSIRNLKDLKQLILELNLSEKITIIEKERVESIVDDRKNVSEFLKSQDIILSYSNSESFHYSFAEGLLSGLEGFYNMWHNPMIEEFWADWGYISEDELIDAILKWSNLSNDEKLHKAYSNREYVVNNFSSESISRKFEQLINNSLSGNA